jgi:hypothetical protein
MSPTASTWSRLVIILITMSLSSPDVDMRHLGKVVANDYSPITIAKRLHEDGRHIMTDAAWRLVADFTAFVSLRC